MRLGYRTRQLLVALGLVVLLAGVLVVVLQGTPSWRLLRASYEGDPVAVEQLLEEGADFRARDGWDGSALMYAAGGGHLKVVAALIEAGAPIDERSRMRRTPLMWAARKGHLAVVQCLVEAGARLDLTDRDEKTAAGLAAEQGFPETHAYLIAAAREAGLELEEIGEGVD